MKQQKVKSTINLETLAGGAFAEKLNEALAQVAENIQNPNTDPTAKRGISVSIKFTPNKTRQMASTTISVQTKLAPTEAIDTQLVMGMNMRTGEIEIAEYDGQVRGQMRIQDIEAAAVELDEVQASEANAQTQQSGKPLNLRNRGKKQDADLAMVAGRDFDPETGEVYETAGQTADDRGTTAGKVFVLNKAAAQA